MMPNSPYLEDKLTKDERYCNMQVVFVDVVSYSMRDSHAQMGVIEAFTKAIEKALWNTAGEYQEYLSRNGLGLRENVVVLPLGDGAAIAFPFEGLEPRMHLFFAGELLRLVDESNRAINCREFKNTGWCNCHPAFYLRCGVSEGKLILFEDLNGRINVAGKAVNMASRVMGLANSCQVFLTAEAYGQAVEWIPNARKRFKEYREVQIKHGLAIDVYQYIDRNVKGLDVSLRHDLRSAKDPSGADEKKMLATRRPESTKAVNSKKPVRNIPDGGVSHLLKQLRAQMVRIPAGEVTIGTPQVGQVHVRISRPFLIGKYPVTQDVYTKVMGVDSSRFKGGDRPVDRVSWVDATTFCNKFSKLSGLEPTYEVKGSQTTFNSGKNGYRLPTEAEWEYCCRAGSQEDRYGSIDDIAWYNGNSGGQTQEVGKKAPNAFGLYDMLGNVWEWCNDWYLRFPKVPQVDYVGPRSGSERVLRGGSWSDLPNCILAGYRQRKAAISRESIYGFRVVLP